MLLKQSWPKLTCAILRAAHVTVWGFDVCRSALMTSLVCSSCIFVNKTKNYKDTLTLQCSLLFH